VKSTVVFEPRCPQCGAVLYVHSQTTACVLLCKVSVRLIVGPSVTLTYRSHISYIT